MSAREKMTIDERYKYLRLMQDRYLQASRRERGALHILKHEGPEQVLGG
ncbi:MAG: hypothetical protein J7M34_06645 [Anaerolineae bacterium]|nr:hypothetical protein [Anaerolineae bacterium]